MRRLALLCLLLAAAQVGCGEGESPGDERDEVARAALAAFRAMALGDGPAVCRLATPDAFDSINAYQQALLSFGEEEPDGAQIDCRNPGRYKPPRLSPAERREVDTAHAVKVTVRGAKGRATIAKGKRDDLPLALRKVDGTWKVSDLDPTGEIREFTREIRAIEKTTDTARNLDCGEFRFDKQRWIAKGATEGKPPTPRHRLADALIKCRTLIGLERKEVIGLLGAPYDSGGTSLRWDLGDERSLFAVDHELLVVELHGNRVRSVDLAQS